MKLCVLKFGSSVLRSEADLPEAVHEIYRAWRSGERVVAIVSAFGSATDELLGRARSVCAEPDPALVAQVLATGETLSAQLLALALQRAGIPAHALDPRETGLTVAGPPLDADPIALETAHLLKRLAERPVLVLPGFVGIDRAGRLCVLGRGGSDLSAVFIAHALCAERCALIKDVDGLYESDPKKHDPKGHARKGHDSKEHVPKGHDPRRNGSQPRRFATLSYSRALALEDGIVQHKAVRFAERCGLSFEVRRAGEERRTLVGAAETRFADEATRFDAEGPPFDAEEPFFDQERRAAERLRVALLGCGEIGLGVYEELRHQENRFELVAVAVRDRRKALSRGVAGDVLCSADEILARDPDVLVELSGSADAERWIRAALREGVDVVSAHKDLLARRASELEALATGHGARILFSAAVGGALPALETVRRLASHGPLRSVEGILNGTSNFVLCRVEEGASLSEALSEARERGYSEADPSRDLDGRDAACKLALLAREAFGAELDPERIPRAVLDSALARRARAFLMDGLRLRLIAKAERVQSGVTAAIEAVWLPEDHFLANASGVENALIVTPEKSPRSEKCESEFLRAAGAGRWPTTEAVLADLMDLWRVRNAAENAAENEEAPERFPAAGAPPLAEEARVRA